MQARPTLFPVLAGAVLVIIIVFMAVTSSGASEMVAVSSLFTFDVYRRYINPKVSLKSYPVILCFHNDEEWADLFPPCVPSDRLCQSVQGRLTSISTGLTSGLAPVCWCEHG